MKDENYSLIAMLIRLADDAVLAMIGEANIAYKCSYFDCDICPFNYCDDVTKIPKGYCGCIFADAGAELNIRKSLLKSENAPE